jgi:AraC-like DNA-binding protein
MSLLSTVPAARSFPLSLLLHVQAVPFLFGPTLYGYAKTIMRLDRQPPVQRVLHILPFVLINLLDLCIPGSLSASPFPAGRSDSFTIPLLLLGLANAASVIGYGLVVHGLVRRYRKDACNFYASDRSALTLRWLGLLALANLALFGLSVLLLAIAPFVPALSPLQPEMVLTPAIACFLFAFILFAHDQKMLDVYRGDTPRMEQTSPDDKNGSEAPDPEVAASGSGGKPQKYARSALTDKRLEILFGELESYMRDRKPFLDAELDLDRVTRELGYPRHEISQAINTKTGGNFYAYVNSHRVAAFILSLGTYPEKRPSFTTLAFESGFSSQSSFYSAVKRVTGSTPKELADSCTKETSKAPSPQAPR